MTTENLTLLAGTLLSLGFSYIPGVSDWYRRLGEKPDGGDDGGTTKRLVMLVLLLLTTLGIFALACAGLGEAIGINVTCDLTGGAGLIKILILALIANQATYQITPKKTDPKGTPIPAAQR